VHYE
jgi:hypothetical protein